MSQEISRQTLFRRVLTVPRHDHHISLVRRSQSCFHLYLMLFPGNSNSIYRVALPHARPDAQAPGLLVCWGLPFSFGHDSGILQHALRVSPAHT